MLLGSGDSISGCWAERGNKTGVNALRNASSVFLNSSIGEGNTEIERTEVGRLSLEEGTIREAHAGARGRQTAQ